jgi:hypothetical protein
MPDLSDIVKDTIPGYPICPVDSLCKKVSEFDPEDFNEKLVKDLINEIISHEGELRRFRQQLEIKLMDYSINNILNNQSK